MENSKIKVMIVDDNMIIRKLLKKILGDDSTIGEVVECKTFTEATQQIESIRPDIVALDVILPDVMDIPNAMNRILYRPHLPIVILASHSQEGMSIAIDCLYRHAVDFIGKPDTKEEMKAWEARGSLIAAQIKRAARFNIALSSPKTTCSVENRPQQSGYNPAQKVIVLTGAGGSYPVLLEILGQLAILPQTAVVILQYMSDLMLDFFVAHINKSCHFPLIHPRSEQLKEGHIYVVSVPESVVSLYSKGDMIFVETTSNPNMLRDMDCAITASEAIQRAAQTCMKNLMAIILPGVGVEIETGIMAIQNNGGHVFLHRNWCANLPSKPSWINGLEQISTDVVLEVMHNFAENRSTSFSQSRKIKGIERENQIIANLREMEFFSSISTEDLHAFLPHIKMKRFEAGNVILNRGDIGNQLFIIYRGEVDVVQANSEGRETILTSLKQGECFGEMSLLSGEPVSATIRVNMPTILVMLKDLAFHQIIAKYPKISVKLTQLLAKRLKRSNTQIITRVISGMSGQLETIGFPELIQTLGTMESSGILYLDHSGKEGKIYFKNGAVVDATLWTKEVEEHGEESFFNMLQWKTGNFSFEKKEIDHPRCIVRDTISLLLEAMRRFDEENK